MCSQALVTSASSLRAFGGKESCSPLCQKDLLKVLQICGRQRCKSSGSSSQFCERAYTSMGSQICTFQCRKRHVRQTHTSIVNALPPEAVSVAAAIVIVGASAVALLWMNQDKLQAMSSETEKCGSCDGSGLCSACNGEGFQLKDLSAEAAGKARANARNAATRYTAGLAKKWSYCPNCSGSRKCPACDGRDL
ncbi:hypothetical protein GOP47_0023545 [Adiantum capillus-veneris]|uniref:DUF7895 domain-containing protein n=1 Tax=Adiantum capillus-veneris TaxID=13818 RepID=A0A9D4U466_ADICA|nr:hypothetical protein GOP47_0023545 [Adiantum capillus-veneris]